VAYPRGFERYESHDNGLLALPFDGFATSLQQAMSTGFRQHGERTVYGQPQMVWDNSRVGAG